MPSWRASCPSKAQGGVTAWFVPSISPAVHTAGAVTHRSDLGQYKFNMTDLTGMRTTADILMSKVIPRFRSELPAVSWAVASAVVASLSFVHPFSVCFVAILAHRGSPECCRLRRLPIGRFHAATEVDRA